MSKMTIVALVALALVALACGTPAGLRAIPEGTTGTVASHDTRLANRTVMYYLCIKPATGDLVCGRVARATYRKCADDEAFPACKEG